MGRKRIVDPEFWSDHDVGALAPPVRLLFIATWSIADDAGLLEADAARIRGEAFRYDTAVDDAAIESWLAALSRGPRAQLLPYRVAGRRYFVVRTFHRWQRVDHPTTSRLPRPPAATLKLLDREHATAVRQRTREPLASVRENSRAFAPNLTNVTKPKSTEARAGARGTALSSSVARRPDGGVDFVAEAERLRRLGAS